MRESWKKELDSKGKLKVPLTRFNIGSCQFLAAERLNLFHKRYGCV